MIKSILFSIILLLLLFSCGNKKEWETTRGTLEIELSEGEIFSSFKGHNNDYLITEDTLGTIRIYSLKRTTGKRKTLDYIIRHGNGSI